MRAIRILQGEVPRPTLHLGEHSVKSQGSSALGKLAVAQWTHAAVDAVRMRKRALKPGGLDVSASVAQGTRIRATLHLNPAAPPA